MLGRRKPHRDNELLSSTLLNQDTFYGVFRRDLAQAQHEVIIESPFISFKRLHYLLPIFRTLLRHQVRIVINTKHPEEQEASYIGQAEERISMLQKLGVQVLYTGGHHRKLAIIDREVLYEGSLNILSQNDSCEIMRRIKSEQLAWQMIEFVGICKYL
jgi:phosphatidylserine/phosphatidylglycerophosphate/cardiolipin synthase-like enzyme